MADYWQYLIGNLAVVALFISTWVHGHFVFAGRPKIWRNVAFGTLMGLGAVASMLMSIQIQPGVLFDLRASLIAIAAFFGGPVAALAAVVIAIICRLTIGGAGAIPGAMGMIFVATGALVVSALTRGRMPALMSATILALSVALIGPISGGTLKLLGLTTVTLVSLPVSSMNALATLVSAFFIMRQRVTERERDLLRAAFVQSPDFHFVKTPDSRFAAVNESVARFHGFDSPAAMAGKTDHELIEPDRAARLLEDEQKIVATGKGFADREEVMTDLFGVETWFTTSKVPLRNADGAIIGIGGVTHDITSQKRLQAELKDNRNRLDYVLSGVSDGIAMFDSQGTLAYVNKQYRALFPLTSGARRTGQHIRDILMEVVETGEQVIPKGHEEEWIDQIAASLTAESEEEVQLYDGRWLLIRTRPTAEGSALVMVSDLTKIKQAERALQSMTDQLKLLATTDGLTGLTNRRAFDSALETEVSRCRREGTPLSLMMIDVDRFKAYNDIYGHVAGDAVLKRVAQALKETLKRPADVAARYGGEEFVAILPGTGEDGAFFIADEFRGALHAANMPHSGGDKGYVTASVGVATFTQLDSSMDGMELVRRADEALYIAKEAGRDRVTGWREKHEVRPLSARA